MLSNFDHSATWFCRSQKMLQYAHLLAKIDADIAENEPNLAIMLTNNFVKSTLTSALLAKPGDQSLSKSLGLALQTSLLSWLS